VCCIAHSWLPQGTNLVNSCNSGDKCNCQNNKCFFAVMHACHCKKGFVILTIIFFTRVATVDMVLGKDTRIVSHGQLWAIQCTWSIVATGTIKLLQRLGRLLGHQISAVCSKRALFPHKDPCHVNCSTTIYLCSK